MRRGILLFGFVVCSYLASYGQWGLRPPMRQRPELPADTPMVHDPVMAYSQGVYHLFATGRGIAHYVSSDMTQWREGTPVMSVMPAWTTDSVPKFRDHVWAPDVIYYRGRWWMAYSCSSFGVNTSAIGLISTQELYDGAVWQDEGALVCSREGRDNWNAIDPNFVIDEEGNAWLVFGSFWDGIQIVPLDTTMHVARPYAQHTLARRYAQGRENPIEAPFVFRHGDYYYLFVSWDYCCRGSQSTYKVVVGRSKNVDGPYVDEEGVDMLQGGGTLVIEGDKVEYDACGHSAAYAFDDVDYFICHGYSVKYDGMSVLMKKKINWVDGWPRLVDF